MRTISIIIGIIFIFVIFIENCEINKICHPEKRKSITFSTKKKDISGIFKDTIYFDISKYDSFKELIVQLNINKKEGLICGSCRIKKSIDGIKYMPFDDENYDILDIIQNYKFYVIDLDKDKNCKIKYPHYIIEIES